MTTTIVYADVSGNEVRVENDDPNYLACRAATGTGPTEVNGRGRCRGIQMRPWLCIDDLGLEEVGEWCDVRT